MYVSLYYSHHACFIIFYIINICMCTRTLPYSSSFEAGINVSVRATADGGAKLAGDPKLNIFTE